MEGREGGGKGGWQEGRVGGREGGREEEGREEGGRERRREGGGGRSNTNVHVLRLQGPQTHVHVYSKTFLIENPFVTDGHHHCSIWRRLLAAESIS